MLRPIFAERTIRSCMCTLSGRTVAVTVQGPLSVCAQVRRFSGAETARLFQHSPPCIPLLGAKDQYSTKATGKWLLTHASDAARSMDDANNITSAYG